LQCIVLSWEERPFTKERTTQVLLAAVGVLLLAQ
jgi:hypothetical protein